LVTKTAEEIAEMRAEIQAGTLPPDALKRYREEEDRNVYGYDAVKRRDGSYEEQGYGSAKNMTRNSIEAFRRYHSHSPTFERDLAIMEKQLAECDARRAAERGRNEP
jgi:hypothetical protein